MEAKRLEIVEAQEADLEGIMEVITRVVEDLNRMDLHHWHRKYPNIETFRLDLNSRRLFVLKEDGRILGTIVLTLISPDTPEIAQHAEVPWVQPDWGKSMLVNRLAIDPRERRKGYGGKLMRFAEEYCARKGYHSIRLDTIARSQGLSTLNFYVGLGYKLHRFVYWPFRGNYFAMMEKVLVGQAKL